MDPTTTSLAVLIKSPVSQQWRNEYEFCRNLQIKTENIIYRGAEENTASTSAMRTIATPAVSFTAAPVEHWDHSLLLQQWLFYSICSHNLKHLKNLKNIHLFKLSCPIPCTHTRPVLLAVTRVTWCVTRRDTGQCY